MLKQMNGGVADRSTEMSRDDQILLALTELAYRPSMLPPHLLTGGAMVAALWYFGSPLQAVLWGAAYLAVTLYRVFHQQSGPRTVYDRGSAELYSHKAALGALAASLCWGLLAVFLFPEHDPLGQFFITLFISVIGMTAAIMLAHNLPTAFCFVLPMMIMLVLKLFMIGTTLHIAMGVGGIALIGMQIGTARRQNKTLLETYELRYENQDLITQLSAEKHRTEQALLRSERNNRHLLGVLENSAQGLAVFETVQGLMTWNRDLERMLRLPARLLRKGLSLAEFLGFLRDRRGRAIYPCVPPSNSGWTTKRRNFKRNSSDRDDALSSSRSMSCPAAAAC